MLPDGRAALVSLPSRDSSSHDYAEVHLLTRGDLSSRRLLSSAYDAGYVSSRHLVFARTGAL